MAKGDPGGTTRSRRAAPRSKKGAAGDPELVQLLTPEGERVDSAPRTTIPRRLHRRGVPRALPRPGRWSASSTPRRPPCSARASWASGPACSARRPPRSAPAGRCAPQDMAFPTYREHGVALLPGHRPDHAARPVPRRRPGRLGPERVQVQPVHDRHRRADPARDRLRHGHHHGRQDRHRRRRGGDRLLRRRRDQPGRRQRGVRLGQRLQRAGRVLLPEQPVRDLRAARAADPDPALPAGRAASASPASGSTATTCSPCYAVTRRRSTTPGTGRARR